jgi:tape measure domain-containing protein
MSDSGKLEVALELTDKGFTVTARDAGRVISEFGGRLKTVDDTLKKHEESHSSAARSFRNFMVTIAATRFALMDFNEVVLALPRSVLKAGGELEKLTQLMRGLSKETDQVRRNAEAMSNVNFVINMAQSSPFEIQALSDSFVKLKAGGIDPTRGSMQALVNEVAKFGGTSETLKRASVAIQQMAGKGVISMEELRQQLGEAIPTAMQSMATGMGMSMDELVKAISKGTVKAKPALERMFLVMKAQSSGAALEMMETWSGATQMMATQWTLFQKQVFDANFGKEMTSLAKEIGEVFKTDEAKRFATTLGQTFSEAVKITRELVKQFAEVWPQIKLVGTAMITYFVGSKVLKGIASITEAYTRQVTAIKMTAAANEAAALAANRKITVQAAAEAQILQAQISTNLLRVANEKKTIDAMLLLQAEYQARAIALQASANASGQLRIPKGQPGAGTFMSKDASASAIEASKALAAQQAIEIANRKAMIDSLRQENATMVTTVGKKQALATATANAAAGIGAASRAASFFSATLGLLGGPIGATITALSIIIPLWMAFGNKGEEAIKKIKNAMDSGTADKETVDAIDKRIAETQKKLAAAELNRQKTLEFSKNNMFLPPKDVDKDVNRYKRELSELQTQRTEAYQQSKKNESDKIVQINQVAIDRRLAELSKQHNAEVGKINTDFDAKKLVPDSAPYKKAMEQKLADITAANNRFFKAQYDFYKQRQTKLEADIALLEADRGVKGDSAALNAKRAELDANTKAFNEASRQMSEAQSSLGNSIGAIGASKGILAGQRFIDKLLEQASTLAAQLQGGAKGASNLYAELEKLQTQQVRAAGEKGSKGVISEQESQRAKTIIELIDRMEAQKDAQKTLNDVTENASSKASQYNAELESESKVVAKLTDTLNLAMRGLGINATEEQINSYQRAIAKVKELGDLELKIHARRANEYVAGMQAETGVLIAELGTRGQQLDAAFEKDLTREQKKLTELKKLSLSSEDQKKAEEELSNWIVARRNKLALDLEGPMEKLARQWADVTDNMKNATADWAKQGMDWFMTFAETGKMNFSSLVTSILKDILRIQAQKTLGGAFNQLFSYIGNAALSFMSGGTGAPTTGTTPIGPPSPFAKGGVMSKFGSLPLQKYAMGGIATSPQLALFGEGRQNEAYVPLPDGRSIPVTMKGGGAPNVVVNVINQSGQEVSATQGEPRMDAGQMVLDVVLSAANRPGAFRDGLRGAVR